MTELRKKLYEALGFSIVSLVIVCGSIAAVYLIIGEFTDAGRHWLATGLVFAVPIAWLLGYRTARAHITGVERGISLRGQSAPRAAAPKAAPVVASPAARWADLPPESGSLRIPVQRADTHTIIDM